MSTYSKKTLIDIYQDVYKHVVENIEKNVKYDHHQYMPDLINVAKFASLIFNDSSCQEAQEMARYYDELVKSSHKEMMKNLENGEHVYACICIKEMVENMVSKFEEEDIDEEDEEYEKWLSYSSLVLED